MKTSHQPDESQMVTGSDARDGEHLRVIDEVSAALAEAFDENDLFERLVAAVVPALADGVVVRGRRGAEPARARHRDPAHTAALATLIDPGTVTDVMQTGATRVVSEGLAAIGARSALVVAARSRGETLGVVVLVTGEREYGEGDRRAAVVIGRQVGAALGAMGLSRQVASERQRLHDMIDTIPGIVWETWGEPDERTQRTNFVSDHVTEMIGYTPEDWLTTPNFWLTILHPDDRERAVRRAKQKFEGRTDPGDAYGNEFRWLRRDGREIWVRSESTVVHGPDGAPIGMRGFTFDITARKQSEAARAVFEAEAKANEQKFRALAETMPQLVWTTLPDGYHEYYNQRWYDYTGTTLEETRGEGWSKLLHPDDLARTITRWNHSLKTGELYEIEYRLRRASDGQYRWFLGRALPMRGPDGRIERWFGTCTEIDAQRRTSDTTRFLAEVTDALVGSLDLRETLSEVTRRVVPQLADWCAIDLLDENGAGLERVDVAHVDPAKVDIAWQLWREFPVDLSAPRGPGEIMRTRRPQLVPVITPEMLAQAPMPERQRELLMALGLQSSLMVPLVARGRVLGVLTLVAAESQRHFDESDQLFAEELAARVALGVDSATLFERLRSNERRYRSLIDASSQTVWTNTPEGEMRGEQPGWAALTGQTQEQYQGYGWSEALHPDDRAPTVDAWNHAVATRTTFHVEHRVLVGDGTYHDFSVRGVPVLDEEGRIREWVGVHTDITARKQAERDRERLIEALAKSNQDLDQFAYIASHDLKAPLRGIANLSHWIEDDLSAVVTDEAREHLRLLRGRVQRLEGLIDGILSYSRAVRQREPVERVDTGALVRELVELLAPPPTVVLKIAPGMPVIESERIPLQQVLMNLISNALKYAGSTAVIEVEVSERPGGLCEFRVTDDGPGIDPRYHERIWGIFQTLAARDKVESTGIGLAVVKKIVEAHGGQVGLRSAEGEGSTFSFTWPRSEQRVWRAPTSGR